MTEWKYIKQNSTTDDIAAFEVLATTALPEELRQFMLEHNNGQPKPNGFDTPKSRGRVFDKLLSLNESDRENVFSTYELLNDELPNHLVAVAADPFGNFICLDKKNELRVVFWEHETGACEPTGKLLPDLINDLY